MGRESKDYITDDEDGVTKLDTASGECRYAKRYNQTNMTKVHSSALNDKHKNIKTQNGNNDQQDIKLDRSFERSNSHGPQKEKTSVLRRCLSGNINCCSKKSNKSSTDKTLRQGIYDDQRGVDKVVSYRDSDYAYSSHDSNDISQISGTFIRTKEPIHHNVKETETQSCNENNTEKVMCYTNGTDNGSYQSPCTNNSNNVLYPPASFAEINDNSIYPSACLPDVTNKYIYPTSCCTNDADRVQYPSSQYDNTSLNLKRDDCLDKIIPHYSTEKMYGNNLSMDLSEKHSSVKDLDKMDCYDDVDGSMVIDKIIPHYSTEKMYGNNLSLDLSENHSSVKDLDKMDCYDDVNGSMVIDKSKVSNSNQHREKHDLELDSYNLTFEIESYSENQRNSEMDKLKSGTYKRLSEFQRFPVNEKLPTYSFLEEPRILHRDKCNMELTQVNHETYCIQKNDRDDNEHLVNDSNTINSDWNNISKSTPLSKVKNIDDFSETNSKYMYKSLNSDFFSSKCHQDTPVKTNMGQTKAVETYVEINIGGKYSISDYVKKEWRGNTEKAEAIRKGYENIPFLFNLYNIRIIRGDNYCSLRSTVFQILANHIPIEKHIGLLTDCLKKMEKFQEGEYAFLQEWNFAGRIEHQESSVYQLAVSCVECLYQQMKACRSKDKESVEEYLIRLLNMNPEIDIQLLEAVKCLMMLKALKYYEDYKNGLDVPFFVWLLFARDTSDTPETFMHNHMNKIGDSGGMEQVEMFLLGYTLGIKITVARPYRPNEEDFISHFPDEEEFPSVTLIAEDDRHYNVLV